MKMARQPIVFIIGSESNMGHIFNFSSKSLPTMGLGLTSLKSCPPHPMLTRYWEICCVHLTFSALGSPLVCTCACAASTLPWIDTAGASSTRESRSGRCSSLSLNMECLGRTIRNSLSFLSIAALSFPERKVYTLDVRLAIGKRCWSPVDRQCCNVLSRSQE
jgi:hypothetical protein